MFVPNQMVWKAIYTPAKDVVGLTLPTCKTGNCTWVPVSSLAVCVDQKSTLHHSCPSNPSVDIYLSSDVTNQLIFDKSNATGPGLAGAKWTLPNGVRLERAGYGFGDVNISTGASLLFNDTDVIAGSLFNFFVIHFTIAGDGLGEALAYEVLMHWCVNTYNISVTDNIPTITTTSSHTIVRNGEVFVEHYNMTMNATYLVTPEDEGMNYLAGGYGPNALRGILYNTLCGYETDTSGRMLDSGPQAMMTAINDAKIGLFPNQTQLISEAKFVAVKNVTTNIANGLTNAYGYLYLKT
jgi:hypothetical protein